ncbi:reverse transcriptase/maturase family protein [Streptomyces sp. NPDC058405]|uniref:reverse transcriptase/maturase family protein n=1 Tax=unclassified Streptomyces TaxID=2593676 RepID=UPI003659334A
MQRAEALMEIIHERGKRGLPLERLYRHLFNPELYLRAYGKIYRNDGSMMPGSTMETVDGMSLKKIQVIIDALRHERYRWTPVRRVYAEKKGSPGKRRPLGLPSWSDKLLQEVIRSLLEAYYEPQFSDRSHGFRPGKGCHTALAEVSESWRSMTWFVEGDISQCFDRLDHGVLHSTLAENIHDNRFLRLIDGLLQAVSGGMALPRNTKWGPARGRSEPLALQYLPGPAGQVCRDNALARLQPGSPTQALSSVYADTQGQLETGKEGAAGGSTAAASSAATAPLS